MNDFTGRHICGFIFLPHILILIIIFYSFYFYLILIFVVALASEQKTMDFSMYEAQATSINIDDIARNSNNREVLRRIQRNNAGDWISLCIQSQHWTPYGGEEDCIYYFPEGACDMGWLGYFVSKNEHLQELIIKPFTSMSGADYVDVIVPFFRGVNNNKSIREISFVNVILLGGEMFTMLTPFFQNNYNLTNIVINECDFGDEGCRLFALTLGTSSNRNISSVTLEKA